MYFGFLKSKESKKMIKAKAYGLIKYCCEKAIEIDTYNMVASGEKGNEKEQYLEYNREFRELQKLNGHCDSYNSRKAYPFVISPQEENVNKETLINMGRDYLEKFYPNGQAILAVHNDNGRNHLHIIINAVQTDLKKIQYSLGETERNTENGSYKEQAKYVEETLAKKYGLNITTEKERKLNKNKDVVNKHIDYQYQLHREKPTDKTTIQDTIYEIIYKNNEKFDNINELNDKLKPLNIEIKEFTNDKKQQQYRYYKTDTGRNFSGASLGNIFEKNELDKAIFNQKSIQNDKIEEEYTPQETTNYNDTDFDNLVNKYAKDYDNKKDIKATKDKLYDEIIDKIEDIDDKKLKIYNKKYNTEYSKDYFYKKLDNFYKDTKSEPKIIVKNLTDLLKLVINIIKDIIDYSNQYSNNNTRGL